MGIIIIEAIIFRGEQKFGKTSPSLEVLGGFLKFLAKILDCWSSYVDTSKFWIKIEESIL